MKKKILLTVIFLASALGLSAATNDLTSLLQQGLFDEEANHDLTSAIADYQSLATQFDRDRQVAATAIYRLGECHRKLGETNEAVGEYQRILKEFGEQKDLVTLSQQNLSGLGVATGNQFQQRLSGMAREATSGAKTSEDREAQQLLAEEIKVVEQQLADAQKQFQVGAMPQNGIWPLKQKLLELKRQKVALEAGSAISSQSETGSAGDLSSSDPTDAGKASTTASFDGLHSQYAMLEAQLEEARAETNMLLSAKILNDKDLLAVVEKLEQSEQELALLKAHGASPRDLEPAETNFKIFTTEIAERRKAIFDYQQDRLKILELAIQQSHSGMPGSQRNSLSEPPASDPESQEIARLQDMLKNSPDLINGPNGELAKAAGAGELRVAAFLLEHGADINGTGGEPPLIAAARNAQKSMVEFLLERGANVNARDTSGSTALLTAARAGYQAVVDVLLAHKVDVNEPYTSLNSSETPLHVAAEFGFPNIVHSLLAAGANPNVMNDQGRTPLSYAAGNDSPDSLKFLLAAKADSNGDNFRPPLLVAIGKGNTIAAELLLQAGASPDASGQTEPVTRHFNGGRSGPYLGQFTPLRLAIVMNDLPMVQLLLKYHANPNNRAQGFSSPLANAIDKTNILAALLGTNADPNALDDHGRTPMSYAEENKLPESVKLLLAAKADPNAGTLDVPLLGAIEENDLASAELLLQAGADPNKSGKIDWQGQTGTPLFRPGGGGGNGQQTPTPLWLAIHQQELPMVQLLLKFKADPNDQQVEGRSLLFDALSNTNILETLLAGGAAVDSRDPISQEYMNDNKLLNLTPLMMALAHDLPAGTVKILLDHGANPNLADYTYGRDSLYWSIRDMGWGIWMPNREIVELLLKHKADPNLRNFAGETALDRVKFALGRCGPDRLAAIKQLAELLRRHGALDQLPDWNAITVSRPSQNYSSVVFTRETNDWNQFTVVELLAAECKFLAQSPAKGNEGTETMAPPSRTDVSSANSFQAEMAARMQARRALMTASSRGSFFTHYSQALPFPDLAQVHIHRPISGQTNVTEQTVNLAACLDSGDCSNDVFLKWGDVVEVPETDHPIDASWEGLSVTELVNLDKCLTRQIAIIVKGETNHLTLALQVNPADANSWQMVSFWLGPVLLQSKLLLASSDLSRVTVTRREAETGKAKTWTVDCRGITENHFDSADLWLRNGDVIEVPERP